MQTGQHASWPLHVQALLSPSIICALEALGKWRSRHDKENPAFAYNWPQQPTTPPDLPA